MTRINYFIIKFSCKPENVVKSVNAKSFIGYAEDEHSGKYLVGYECNKSRLSASILQFDEISSLKCRRRD